MAYCTNCGAYIPDGETKCVACGMDSASAKSAASFSAAAAQAAEEKKESVEDMRSTLEEKQREQQRKSREWAEKAYAEHQQQANKTSERTGGVPTAAKKPDVKGKASTSKLLAGLSYVSFLCFLPFILTSQSDDFARFHGKQGILLFIGSIVIDIISRFSGIAGLVLSVLRLYLIYVGIKNVVEGKAEPLPYIGQYADKF